MMELPCVVLESSKQFPVTTSPMAIAVAGSHGPCKETALASGERRGRHAVCLIPAYAREIGCGDTQSGEILLLNRRQRLSELTLGASLEHGHDRELRHQHEGSWSRGLFLIPARKGVSGRLHVVAQRPFHQPPEQQLQP
jgi:hypothetical protein